MARSVKAPRQERSEDLAPAHADEHRPVVRFEGVTVVGASTVVVDDLTMVALDGRITSMVGPPCSGLTTVLRLVNALERCTRGTVFVDQLPVEARDSVQLRRRTGWVTSHPGLFPHRTAIENVMTVPLLLGQHRTEAADAARSLMQRLGIDAELANRFPGELPRGMAQRVAVARALAADPPVILLDEPFVAVDPVTAAELRRDLVPLLTRPGRVVLYATHDVDEALSVGDDVALFQSGGRLAQIATPLELLARPASEGVAALLGAGRGLRRLSFIRIDAVQVSRHRLIRIDALAAAARDALAPGDPPWLLVVDADDRPVGWVDTSRLPAEGPITAAPMVTVDRVVTAGDTLFTALDHVVSTPARMVVRVDDDGRVLGVLSGPELAAHLPWVGV